MTVTSVETDYDDLTITLIAEFDAPIEQVWELWSDPRKLERWWGPPSYPATFEKHDLTPGGGATYFMSGPEGAMWGTWHVRAVNPPISLEFTNAFADADGRPVADKPVFAASVRLAERERGTRMELHLRFESRDEMKWMVSQGTVDGVREAVGQIDALFVVDP